MALDGPRGSSRLESWDSPLSPPKGPQSPELRSTLFCSSVLLAMAKDDGFVQPLADLVGLGESSWIAICPRRADDDADASTVKDQVLPSLAALSTRAELEDHLTSLLGSGTKQSSFIESYAASRFPTAPPAKSPPSAPSQARTETPLSFGSSFGNEAGVYIKNRDEAFFAGSGGRKGRATPRTGSAPGSGTSTPALAPSGRESPAATPPVGASLSPPPLSLPRKTSPSPTVSNITLTPEAAARLRRFDEILESLAFSPNRPLSNPCFCATRLHPAPLAPLPPICTRCALVLCDLTPPLGPCPSCSHRPLMPAGLAEACLAHFGSERASLVESEKRRAEEEARLEREEARREKFPELGGGAGGGAANPMHRGYAASAGGGPSLDARIAQGFAKMEAQAQGRARAEAKRKEEAEKKQTVLRLTKDGKAKVVTKVPAAHSPTPATKEKQETRPRGWIDDDDDGWRRQKGQQPVLAPTRPKVSDGGPRPGFRLSYKPPRTYEAEGAEVA